jgi:cell shape-determining protein MreC
MELEEERDKLKREKTRLKKEVWIKETVEKIDKITKKGENI